MGTIYQWDIWTLFVEQQVRVYYLSWWRSRSFDSWTNGWEIGKEDNDHVRHIAQRSRVVHHNIFQVSVFLQTKLREGNVFTRVCLFTGGLPSHNAMEQAEPPPPPLSRNPLRRQTPYHHQDTPYHHQDTDTTMGYGQQAGGTYPIGMHTSCLIFWINPLQNWSHAA